MADKIPLKISSGEVQQFVTGDTIPLANGGTGATTAAGARTNLGVNASVINWGITNTSGQAVSDAANVFFGQFTYGTLSTSSSAARRFIFPVSGTSVDMNFLLIVGTVPTTETGTWIITNFTTSLSVTVTSSYVTATGLSQYLGNALVFTQGDTGEIKFTAPTYVTNPTLMTVSGQLYFK